MPKITLDRVTRSADRVNGVWIFTGWIDNRLVWTRGNLPLDHEYLIRFILDNFPQLRVYSRDSFESIYRQIVEG